MAPQTTATPYDAIATPIQASPAASSATAPNTSTPYDAIATPIPATPPDQPGVLARSYEGVKQFAKPIVDLVRPPENSTEQVVHAVGSSSGAGPAADYAGGKAALAAYRIAKGVVDSAENLVTSAPAKYKQAGADFSRAVSDFHNKDYRNMLSDVISTSADVSPVPDGGAIRELSEGARPGGNLATPLTRDALIAGSMLIGGIKNPWRVAPEAAAAETEAAAPGLIRRALQSPEAKGERVAQPIAQAGVKATAPTVGASLRSGIDVNTPFAEAKTLYQTVDNAAKTNFQDLYAKLDAAQDDARQAASNSAEEAKAQLNVKNTQDAIDDAKAIAAKSNVPDVDKMLAQADAKFTEAQANKDLNSKFFGSNSVVKGNVAHGAPETIDVDNAINTLENLDKPNKFGVSRLQQTSLGKDGAFKLKQVLYDAQKAGEKAVNSRELRNKIAAYVAGGGGLIEGARLAFK